MNNTSDCVCGRLPCMCYSYVFDTAHLVPPKSSPSVPFPEDPIVEAVLSRMKNRAVEGLQKYGVPMTRTDMTTLQWLRHAQEEALDSAIYIERIIHDLENLKGRL